MSRGPITRRPMTPDEQLMARAVAAPTVQDVVGSPDQRFARRIGFEASRELDAAAPPLISQKESMRLVVLCLRMRRQLDPQAIAVAERRILVPPRRLAAPVATAILLLAIAAGCSNCWAVPGCKAPTPAPAPKDTVRR